jgi:hypothetical protein
MGGDQVADGRTGQVSLADEEAVKRVLVDSILGLRDVVNDLTRLRHPSARSPWASGSPCPSSRR